ncbi:YhfC family intramembrane metalloprotease [Tumebacillus sp. ITR2]|uniref:YhfC family intramembrane metalloprotease n=1 Tax=Tumebacillus amylolyticus TaxID=2801339 RepID=A0ABS1J6E6_9BACL|nr:YhfC family intramembrane metalloprotease [Tumebacillus amylolyticus]MBL0385792.1 YhfC family intramembrane metalloprotease [Tumebacillus amylolyticus]
MISTSTIVGILLGALLGIAFPIILLVYYRRTQKISWKAIGVGALVWILFSQVLEKAMHVYFLQFNQTTVELLKTPFYYALYGGLAAGVFEEVGRWIGFRYWLKGKRAYNDGIAYGVGHGGVEAVLIMVSMVATNLVYMTMINAGTFESQLGGKVPADQLAQIKSGLLEHGFAYYLLGGFERIPAVLFHIALSLVVLYGVRSGRKVFLLYAILLHAALDFVVALLSKLEVNVFLLESITLLAGILSLVFLLKPAKRWFSQQESLPPNGNSMGSNL